MSSSHNGIKLEVIKRTTLGNNWLFGNFSNIIAKPIARIIKIKRGKNLI